MGYINFKKTNNFKIKFFNLFLLAVVFLVGGFYLVRMNNLVVKGFELQELKSKVDVLAAENQDIINKKISLESYSNIDSRLSRLSMVSIDKIEYLTIADDVIAKR